MFAPFDPLKAAQASAVLLKCVTPHRMSRLRLLKLLYIADRESLAETARTITGDRPIAMKNGPVLTRVYDLIKELDYSAPTWSRYIRNEGKHDLALHRDPGVGKLSRRDIDRLQDVALRYQDWDDWAIADHTHTFQEWTENRPEGNAARDIPIRDMLAAVGLSDHTETLLADAEASALFDQMIATYCNK